jgi:plasmid stabilization system protein ParE
MGCRVIFAASAERDLGDIVRFLARLNPAAAERLGYALFDDAMSLAELPRRGLAVPERPGYRRILHRPWHLIFYLVDESAKTVTIVRIWDARQDPDLLWPRETI